MTPFAARGDDDQLGPDGGTLPSDAARSAGPLAGLRVLEFAGLGPAPHACMLLADLGADVVRIDRPATRPADAGDILSRGKRSVALDLKTPEGTACAAALAAQADVLVEGFRPGVMERLGLGPDALLARHPALIYGRMTGWGQSGPLAQAAGHDLNYIAISGALAAIGPRGGKPLPPLNLVGDFGGGSLFLLLGVLAALFERQRSGLGQVVDAAICDGAASLMGPFQAKLQRGTWQLERGSNTLDGGAHFYGTFACADGKFVSVAALEPQFYALLLAKLGLHDGRFADQMDRGAWPAMSQALEAVFRTRTRAQWCELLEGSDACFAPVLDMREAPEHPHNAARGVFVRQGGIEQPAPAPRLSRTPGSIRGGPPAIGSTDCADVLAQWRHPPAA